MPNDPYMPFYVGDWRSDPRVSRLTMAERGLYRELIDLAWLEKPRGTIPDDIEELIHQIPGGTRDMLTMRQAWTNVRKFWEVYEEDPSRLCNPKMLKITDSIAKRRERAQLAANARWKKDANDATSMPPSICLNDAPLDMDMDLDMDLKSLDPKTKKVLKADCMAWIDCFNQLAGTSYRGSDRHLAMIKSRIRDGFTLDECRNVITAKIAEWSRDPRMAAYIRPETLFSSKFESYLQHARNGHSALSKEESMKKLIAEMGGDDGNLG